MATDTCQECGKPITTMCFKGTGVCCGICLDAREGKGTPRPRSGRRKGHAGSASKRQPRTK